jgi:hypothetical protein
MGVKLFVNAINYTIWKFPEKITKSSQFSAALSHSQFAEYLFTCFILSFSLILNPPESILLLLLNALRLDPETSGLSHKRANHNRITQPDKNDTGFEHPY